MQENHQNEQYFFDQPTIEAMCDWLEEFENPCVICAPMLGRSMHDRGKDIATLDIDERFSDLPRFRRWDLYRPEHLDERFDVIVCDPPFFNVSLSQLFQAMRLLSHFDFDQRLMIGYLSRRASAVVGTFAKFGLEPTGQCPAYQTVKNCERNDIEFFANFETGLVL